MMQRQTWRRSALLAVGALCMVASGVQTTHAEPPEVFSTFKNSKLLQGSTSFVANLKVPAGNYMVTAKLSAFAVTDTNYVVVCTLRAGGDFDRSFTRLAGPSPEQTLTNSVVHRFSSNGTIQLECVDTTSTGSTLLEFIKITAIRVNSISNVPLP